MFMALGRVTRKNPLMTRPSNIYRLLVVLGVLVNASALTGFIAEPAGALQAAIAKYMWLQQDAWHLVGGGHEWLDRPHLPYWIAAASFQLLGPTSLAYKFPALLFWGMGGWYCWRYALQWHGRTVARVTLLIYLTALQLVVSNNDVTTAPYLTGLLMGAVFHYRKAMSGHWSQVVMGSLWTAGAVMTGGLLVLLPLAMGFGWFIWAAPSAELQATGVENCAPGTDADSGADGAGSGFRGKADRGDGPGENRGSKAGSVPDRAWRGSPARYSPELAGRPRRMGAGPVGEEPGRFSWKQVVEQLARPRWWMGILLVLVFLTPEWVAIWKQYKLAGSAAIDAILPGRGNGGPARGDLFYFLPALALAFLPWSAWLYAAVLQSFWPRRRGAVALDRLAVGLALSAFLVFSFSRIQGPRDLNLVFPFFSIVAAQWLAAVFSRDWLWRWMRALQVSVVLFLLAACGLVWTLWGADDYWVLGWIVLGISLVWLCFRGYLDEGHGFLDLPRPVSRLVLASYLGALTLCGFLNMFYYPQLLRYQSGTQAAFWLEKHLQGEAVTQTDPLSYSLEFYAGGPVNYTNIENLIVQARQAPVLVFSSPDTFDSLQDRHCRVQILQRFPQLLSNRAERQFFLPKRKSSFLEERWLAWVTAPNLVKGQVASTLEPMHSRNFE